MYVRVTTGQIQTGTTEELMPVFASTAHQQQRMQRFVSTQLLIDRTASTFIVVTVFATLADLAASATVPQQTMADRHRPPADHG